MVSIEFKGRDLVVRMLGWDKIRALRSTLSVPLLHVHGVRPRPPEAYFDIAITAPSPGVGTYSFGESVVGTVNVTDGRAFYDVRNPERSIAIDLVDDKLCRIVVEVEGETPEESVARIESARRTFAPVHWLV